MSGDEKFVEVLRALLEKAHRDEIMWQKTPSGSYRVEFPASAIEIDYQNSQFEPDAIKARLYNPNGENVITVGAVEGEPLWQPLSSLYAEADRYATGWDRALLDAGSALAGAGRVGIAPAGRKASRAAEITDEDIPF